MSKNNKTSADPVYTTVSAHLSLLDVQGIMQLESKTALTTSAIVRGLIRYGLKQIENNPKIIVDVISEVNGD